MADGPEAEVVQGRVRALTLVGQLEELEATIAKVTPEAVDRVLTPLGLVCRRLVHFGESQGVINPIFFVEALPTAPAADSSPPSTGSEVVELVLRVSNPHPYWHNRKTEHEVAVMEFVRTHARPDVVPVARVLASSGVVASSYDLAQSPLGVEFVLMEKIKGQNLSDLWPDLGASEKREYIAQVVQIMAELRRISAFLPHKGVGSYDSELHLVDLVQDGPFIGPFANFADSVGNHIRWAKYFMNQTLASSPELVQELQPLLTEYMDTVLARYRRSPAAGQEELGLCHNDLNFSNLLVDHERRKIVGVLDWEKSKCSLFDDELRGVEESAQGEGRTDMLWEVMAEHGLSKPYGYECRKGLFHVQDLVTWFLPVKEGDKPLPEQEHAYFKSHAEDLKQTLLTQLRDPNNRD